MRAKEPVSYVVPGARAEFVRKTDPKPAGAVLAFAVLEALLLRVPGVEGLVEFVMSSWLVVGGVRVGDRWARLGASPEARYAGLALCALAEAVIFFPSCTTPLNTTNRA